MSSILSAPPEKRIPPGFTCPWYESHSQLFESSSVTLSIGYKEDGKGYQSCNWVTAPSVVAVLVPFSPQFPSYTMAPIALAARTPALLRNSSKRVAIPAAHSLRTFTAATPNASARLQVQAKQLVQKRNFLSSARCLAAAGSQSAPNPQAYLESGVVKPKETVDVKKVLVIGSGGLAIGQAGEFDYSGSSLKTWRALLAESDESHDIA